MSTILARLLASVFASLLLVCSAGATTISGTYSVTGSNFASSSVPPFATITESFNITFNTTMAPVIQTSGITLNSSSTIKPTSMLGFQYISAADTLIVGGIASTVTTADPGSLDFAVTINHASSLGSFGVTSLSYSVGTGSAFTARTAGRTPDAVAATPEPSTLSLIGTGLLGAIGAVRRRHLA